jgi:hypothetical protein
MKYFLVLVFAYVCILFVFSSCKKEGEETGHVNYVECIDPAQSIHDMQDWYYFKTGTYWVYQEKYSGRIDTITVYEDFAGVNYSYWFYFRCVSSLDGFRNTYWVDSTYSTNCLAHPECQCHRVYRSKWRPEDTNWVGELGVFVYPHYIENFNFPSGLHNGKTTLTQIYGHLAFQKNYYSDVIEWKVDVDDSEDDARVNYVIAKGVGIIQKINFDLREDWRLIDYFVIQ